MNIFAFLQQKLAQKPVTITPQQTKAAMGSKEQMELLSKFGVVTDDLRAALAANDLINFERSSLYTSIDRCFTGDTKVALLDGRDVSMLDLIKEYEAGKVNYVYSIDLEGKRVVRSPIAWAGKTGTLPIMEVTLDNDEIIRCTLDHKFMLRDGTYKRAKELVEGESLMPLYRKIQEKGRYSEGRFFLYDPFLNSYKIQYLYFNPPYPNRPKHSVVHHAFANYHEFDRNILDDTPENHQIITKAQHTEIHRKLCRKGGENWVIRLKTENYEKYLGWCKKIGITSRENHVHMNVRIRCRV